MVLLVIISMLLQDEGLLSENKLYRHHTLTMNSKFISQANRLLDYYDWKGSDALSGASEIMNAPPILLFDFSKRYALSYASAVT